jgi:hypothetical protein
MAIFPTGVYSPRTITNRVGVVYDANDTKTFFAEDLNKTNDEVVALEDFLLNDFITTFKATGAEIDTGTDDTVFATPKAIADSQIMKYTQARFKVGNFSRDVSVASGNVAITGLGFEPSLVIFFGIGVNGTTDKVGIAFYDGTNQTELHEQSGAAWYRNLDRLFNFYYYGSGSNYLIGTGISLDADGFTINWSKTGSPTGTALISYVAFR